MVCFLVSNSYGNSMKKHCCLQKMSNTQEEKDTVLSSVRVLGAEEMVLQPCCFPQKSVSGPQATSLCSLPPLLLVHWPSCTDKSSLQINRPVGKGALAPSCLMEPLFLCSIPHFSERMHFKFDRTPVRWLNHAFNSLVIQFGQL